MGRKICIGWYDLTGAVHPCGKDNGPIETCNGQDSHGIYCPDCEARSQEALIAMTTPTERAREARTAAQREEVAG